MAGQHYGLAAPYGRYAAKDLLKEIRDRDIISGPLALMMSKEEAIAGLEADDNGERAEWKRSFLRAAAQRLTEEAGGEARQDAEPKTEAPPPATLPPIPQGSDPGQAMNAFGAFVAGIVAPQVEQYVRPAVEKILAEVEIPRIEVYSIRDIKIRVEDADSAGLKALLHKVRRNAGRPNLNIWMTGPAGSGKTTAAKSLCKRLYGDEWREHWGFLSLSLGTSESALYGRLQPTKEGDWREVVARFCAIFEQGGIFLLDEVAGADPNVLNALNSALENGQLMNPMTNRIHDRSDDCIIVAADNTWGRGGDRKYAGRAVLDSAFLDRFVLNKIFVDYDKDLEARIVEAHGLDESVASDLLNFVEKVRSAIDRHDLRRICSTRFVSRAAHNLSQGDSLEEVKNDFLIDWSADERAKIEA